MFSHKKRAQLFPSRNGVKVYESYVYVAFVYTSLAQAHQENIFAVFLGKLILRENYGIFSTVVNCVSNPL